MKGWIVHFRLGGNRYYPRQVILEIPGIKSRDFYKLIGRKVVWKNPQTNKKFVGKIVRQHGKGGRVIAVFRKSLPGQALGTEVEII